MFLVYVIGQIIEKYPLVAKRFPFGTWWHERQKKLNRRASWVTEDNTVIVALQEQVASIAEDMQTLQNTVRCFRAWSIYDARWHHRVDVWNADRDSCRLPQHFDFFQFETMWQKDPMVAATLAPT
jgi:hypothetical protein